MRSPTASQLLRFDADRTADRVTPLARVDRVVCLGDVIGYGPQPREVRWLSSDELLVALELPAPSAMEFPSTRLVRVRADGSHLRPVAPARRYFNAEPSPGGTGFSVVVELN